jgi:hypothetical protein
MLPPGPRVVVLPLLDEDAGAWLRGAGQALGEYRALLDRAAAVGVESPAGAAARLHADLGVDTVHLPATVEHEAADEALVVVAESTEAVTGAMRAGTPWVAGTPVAGGAAGGLAVPAREVALAAAHLLADDGARERLGAAGRAHWEAGLGGDALVARYDAVLRGATGLPDAAAPARAAAITDAVLGAFLDARLVANATGPLKDGAAVTRTGQ